MKTLIFSILLIVFTLVSCDNSQAPTEARNPNPELSKVINERNNTFDLGCGVLCEGCCVCLTGRMHTVLHADGRYHHNIVITGYGVDCETGEPNGATYQGSWSENIWAGTTGEFTFNVMGKGQACDFKAHAVVDANGNLRVERDKCID